MLQVLDGTNRYSLTGRAAAIVRWLARQGEHLEQPQKVKVEFNCAGTRVQAKSMVFEDEELTIG